MNQQGLSSAQVEERIAKGLQNTLPASASKSTAQIFKENICTLFNLLNFLIAVALALVGAWTNIVPGNSCQTAGGGTVAADRSQGTCHSWGKTDQHSDRKYRTG